MVKRETKNELSLHLEIITQMITLSTAGFGFVAALAWNSAIQSIFVEYLEPNVPGAGIWSRVIYAFLVTLLAVIITYQLSKLHAHLERSKH